MKKTSHDFKVGDSIKVIEGVTDPDSDTDISGWQGRILDIDKGEDGEAIFLIAWDSHTLKGMTDLYLEQSEIEGLDWGEFYLGLEDIEHAQSRDTQADVDEILKEMTDRPSRYSLEESDKRIEQILAGTEGETEAFEVWEKLLDEKLAFPFEAEVLEYQERGKVRQGDNITVKSISSCDDLYGVIISGKWKGQEIEFPLCDLEVIGYGENRLLVSDYASWFANR